MQAYLRRAHMHAHTHLTTRANNVGALTWRGDGGVRDIQHAYIVFLGNSWVSPTPMTFSGNIFIAFSGNWIRPKYMSYNTLCFQDTVAWVRLFLNKDYFDRAIVSNSFADQILCK